MMKKIVKKQLVHILVIFGKHFIYYLFIVQTLSGLNLNMEQKSRTYESTVLAAIFLLNNYFFIQSTFTK